MFDVYKCSNKHIIYLKTEFLFNVELSTNDKCG